VLRILEHPGKIILFPMRSICRPDTDRLGQARSTPRATAEMLREAVD